MEEILQQHVLSVVQKMEDRVDDQIHAMDKLQEDDFDSLRQKRLKVSTFQDAYLSVLLLQWNVQAYPPWGFVGSLIGKVHHR